MLSPDQLERKVTDLITRNSRVLKEKAELGGQLKSKKEELAKLVEEIQLAGFNPKTLVADKNKAQEELEVMLVDLEKQIDEAERILAEYKSKK